MKSSKAFAPRSLDDIALDAIDGFLLTRPDLIRLTGAPGTRVVARAHLTPSRVAIVSGGGAGHEPAHTGYVGDGMLSAAVVGGIFSSPHISAIVSAMRHVASPAGILLVVKNYTGDRLAFGLAAAKLRGEGTPVEVATVADDAAVDGGKITGRRGLAGTVLVHKIAGALAEGGASLSDTARAARAVAGACVTMGASMTACRIPGQAEPSRLTGPEMELGLGIHGEPGCEVLGSVPCVEDLADAIVTRLLARMRELSLLVGATSSSGSSSTSSSSATRVVVLVNNLGGLSGIELAVFSKAVMERLSAQHHDDCPLEVVRFLAGSFMTALDMRGASVTILPLDGSVAAAVNHAVRGIGAGVTNSSTSAENHGASAPPRSSIAAALMALDANTPCAWPSVVGGAPPPVLKLKSGSALPPLTAAAPRLSAAIAERASAGTAEGAGEQAISSAVSVTAEEEQKEKALLFGVAVGTKPITSSAPPSALAASASSSSAIPWSASSQALLHASTLACCNVLEGMAAQLNSLDGVSGDADAGNTAVAMARAVRAALAPAAEIKAAQLPGGGVAASPASGDARLSIGRHFLSISHAIGEGAGGTSGILYALMFQAAGNGVLAPLQPSPSPSVVSTAGSHVPGPQSPSSASVLSLFAYALEAGVAAAQECGNAGPGDRTMLDALIPARDAMLVQLSQQQQHRARDAQTAAAAAPAAAAAAAAAAASPASSSLSEAASIALAVAAAASAGADATKDMRPQAGRAAYLSFDVVKGVPDPGAVAAAAWLTEVSRVLARC